MSKAKKNRGTRAIVPHSTEVIPTRNDSGAPGNSRSTARFTQLTLWSGPLPSPTDLQAYNEIVPGAADLLLHLLEQQAETVRDQVHHRMDIENFAIRSDAKRADWGLVAGVLVTGFVLAFSAYMVSRGQPIVGGVVALSDIATLAGVFVYGTRSRRQERNDRLKLLSGQQQHKDNK